MRALFQALTGKCRFSKKCGLYQSSAVTCNKEAGPYCGKYREFESKESEPLKSSEAKKTITIPAFHEDDMEGLFKSLGIWEAFIAGKMNCLICKTKLTQDNFGALVPYNDEVHGVCGLLCISKAQRLVQDSAPSEKREKN